MSSHPQLRILTSDIDYRQYRYIELKNGIKGILISSIESEDSNDVKEDQDLTSAIALSIRTGSFCDPENLQGLSHFLEHMVFMGSAKYPMENDFDSFVSRRGGYSNAWTDCERTLFYFEVNRCHFEASLDRFANFFIGPLLREDSIHRELSAVHSEFELANAKDSVRLHILLSSLAKPGSACRLFRCGNRKSLDELPKSQGVDVISKLHELRRRNYSADHMTLAVLEKDTLDNIERRVLQIFSEVPVSPLPPITSPVVENPFDNPAFNRIYLVCPMKDKQTLQLTWALPSLRKHYRSAPCEVISSLVGHEGKGSIIAWLRSKELAVGLSAGSRRDSDSYSNMLFSLFTINIILTDNGVEDIDTVLSACFCYMQMLRNASTAITETTPYGQRRLSDYLPEFTHLRAAEFRFRDMAEPTETVEEVAGMMHYLPPEHLFAGYSTLIRADFELYSEILSRMTPDQANVMITSPSYSKLDLDCTEPWYNIHYTSKDIPKEKLDSWMNADPPSWFHLPKPNQFIAENFDLLPSSNDMKIPININLLPYRTEQRQFGELWYQQCTKFKRPSVNAFVHLWSNIIFETPRSLILQDLLIYAFTLQLNLIVYSATEASLVYSLDFQESGLRLTLNGFKDKLYLLYTMICDLICAEPTFLTESLLNNYKEYFRQTIYNKATKPDRLAKHLQRYILCRNAHLYSDILVALEGIRLEDLLEHRRRFFSRLHITAYLTGNLTEAEAISFFDYIYYKSKCQPLPQRKFTDLTSLAPGAFHRLRVMNPDSNDINACVIRLNLIGQADFKTQVIGHLVQVILNEPAFDVLRTRETLGYYVSLSEWTTTQANSINIVGTALQVNSQANLHSTSSVSGKISAFWKRIAPRILTSMSSELFKTTVNSLITSLQEIDVNLTQPAERNWNEIICGANRFMRREEMITILRSITQQEVVDFFNDCYINPKKSTTILIQIDAVSNPDSKVTNCSHQKSFRMHLDPVVLTPDATKEEVLAEQNMEIEDALTSILEGKSENEEDEDEEEEEDEDQQTSHKESKITQLVEDFEFHADTFVDDASCDADGEESYRIPQNEVMKKLRHKHKQRRPTKPTSSPSNSPNADDSDVDAQINMLQTNSLKGGYSTDRDPIISQDDQLPMEIADLLEFKRRVVYLPGAVVGLV